MPRPICAVPPPPLFRLMTMTLWLHFCNSSLWPCFHKSFQHVKMFQFLQHVGVWKPPTLLSDILCIFFWRCCLRLHACLPQLSFSSCAPVQVMLKHWYCILTSITMLFLIVQKKSFEIQKSVCFALFSIILTRLSPILADSISLYMHLYNYIYVQTIHSSACTARFYLVTHHFSKSWVLEFLESLLSWNDAQRMYWGEADHCTAMSAHQAPFGGMPWHQVPAYNAAVPILLWMCPS
jgi:hypothetical protein